jgi:hypothetical protein
MFSNTKYTKWYYKIIKKYSIYDENIFAEKHHIIPKSLGGRDIETNLVRVSPRVHYVLHLLLFKMTSGAAKRKMYFAVWNMSHSRVVKNGSMYQILREQAKEHMKSIKPKEPWNKGKKNCFSEKTKEKFRKIRKGKSYGKSWKIEYKGIVYNSIKECMKITGDSYYLVTTYGLKLEKYRPNEIYIQP